MYYFAFFLQNGGLGSLLTGLLPFVLIFAVFYFLLILPQRKRQQQLKEMISSLKPGDKVVTNGGIIGIVMAVRDDSITIKSADKSILEIARSAIAGKDVEDVKQQ
jgi:preprotein translocase subunit YajC